MRRGVIVRFTREHSLASPATELEINSIVWATGSWSKTSDYVEGVKKPDFGKHMEHYYERTHGSDVCFPIVSPVQPPALFWNRSFGEPLLVDLLDARAEPFVFCQDNHLLHLVAAPPAASSEESCNSTRQQQGATRRQTGAAKSCSGLLAPERELEKPPRLVVRFCRQALCGTRYASRGNGCAREGLVDRGARINALCLADPRMWAKPRGAAARCVPAQLQKAP